MSINIAIDGPAGAGKSTIAKAAAKRLHFIYADTGALYRTVAYAAINKDGGIYEKEVVEMLPQIKIELKFIKNEQRVFLNGEDVSDKIRTEEISMGASNVSAIPKVRKFLLNMQKNLAAENNIIMDGRDIGTVVLPNADLKIFLTADAEERAKRRWLQQENPEKGVALIDILEDIKKRDYNDMNRDTAPLKKADDAQVLDTTSMSLEESIDMLVSMISEVM